MDIVQFSKKIKTFSKNDVIKTFNETRSMLETLGDPIREMKPNNISFEDLFNVLGHKQLFKDLTSRLPNGLTADHLMAGTIDAALSVNKVCLEEFQKSKGNLISGETITVRQANCLLINTSIDMWIEYTNRLIQCGTTALITKKSTIKKPDQQFFFVNADAYCDITRALFELSGVVIKRLKALPELPVDQATIDILEQTKGKDAVLAMPVREMGVHSFLPVYWLGLGKMEFDLWRIKIHSQRIESNSMKIQQLRDIQLNSPSPANEHAIEVYENSIIKSQDRIESIQRSYDYDE